MIAKLASNTILLNNLSPFNGGKCILSLIKIIGAPRTWDQAIKLIFSHKSEAAAQTSLGNTKKDIAYVLVSGIDQVDFGNKSMNACLKGGNEISHKNESLAMNHKIWVINYDVIFSHGWIHVAKHWIWYNQGLHLHCWRIKNLSLIKS